MPIRAGSTSGWACEDVEGAGEVPQVLGERVPAPHDLVDQVGVAAVVIRRVPVGTLAEAAQVRGQHHDSRAGPAAAA